MSLKPLAATAKEGYLKHMQQQEARNRVDVDIVIDEKKLARDIDRAMKNAIAKLNK